MGHLCTRLFESAACDCIGFVGAIDGGVLGALSTRRLRCGGRELSPETASCSREKERVHVEGIGMDRVA